MHAYILTRKQLRTSRSGQGITGRYNIVPSFSTTKSSIVSSVKCSYNVPGIVLLIFRHVASVGKAIWIDLLLLNNLRVLGKLVIFRCADFVHLDSDHGHNMAMQCVQPTGTFDQTRGRHVSELLAERPYRTYTRRVVLVNLSVLYLRWQANGFAGVRAM